MIYVANNHFIQQHVHKILFHIVIMIKISCILMTPVIDLGPTLRHFHSNELNYHSILFSELLKNTFSSKDTKTAERFLILNACVTLLHNNSSYARKTMFH